MSKSFKGKAQKPPLSTADKVIYGAVMVLLSYITVFGSSYFCVKIARKIAFADPSVVAGDAEIGILCSLPLTLFFMAMVILVYSFGLKKRQPILGNKTYQAPAFAHTIKTYPLFSRDFRENLHPQSRQSLKRTLTILIVLLLACLLLLPFGFYSRRVLTDDHQLVTYNSFNRISDSHDIREAERTTISVSLWRRRALRRPILQLTFEFENTTYFLYIEDFREMSREDALRYILSLKDVLGAVNYDFSGESKLDYMIHYQRYTPAEAELLYQLFDITP